MEIVSAPRDEVAADLARIRRNIDEVDQVLVKLLNQRARWALEIGEVKKSADIAIYQPGREAQVIGYVRESNKGPLQGEAIQRLFERIIDESRRLERIGTGASDEGAAS